MHDLALRILAYLDENPDAHDTSEGIVEWWLLERDIRARQGEIEDALAELTAEGWVIASLQTDSRVRYRLNPERAPEIRDQLARRRG
jgi:hypothetical protein